MATPHTPWKEHILEEIPVTDGDVGDAVTCLLHTILFTRAPGPVRPSEATCHAFPNISYSLCAVGDVSRKVEHAVKSFEESVLGNGASGGRAEELEMSGRHGGAYGGGGYAQRGSFGSSQRLSFGGGSGPAANPVSRSGCLVVAFYHLKLKKALFGLMSTEEKIYFEKWVVPVYVSPSPPSPTQQDVATRETEMALQNALLHILSAVQTIDHVPSSTYYFEINQYASVEAMQSEMGASGSFGLGLQASGRLMT